MTLSKNLQFLKKYDSKLEVVLLDCLQQEATKDGCDLATIEMKRKRNSDVVRDKVIEEAFRSILSRNRVAIARPNNQADTPDNIRTGAKNIYARIKGSHDFELVKSLPVFHSRFNVAPKYRSAFLLSSYFFHALGNQDFVKLLTDNDITNILLAECSPLDFSSVICQIELDEVIQMLKAQGIGLDLVFASGAEGCIEQLFSNIIRRSSSYMYGAYVLHFSGADVKTELVRSWMQRPHGLPARFVSGYGYTTDEINQCLECAVNMSSKYYKYSLKHLPPNRHNALVVASGPSLDGQLDYLRALQDRFVIFAAGSSLLSLLKAGINVDFVVALERGDDTAYDYIDVQDQFPCVADIICLRSSTSSPLFNKVFKHTIFYHRPLAAAMAFTIDEEGSTLPHAGPESINAAYDSALALGFRNIYLLGADFCAADPQHYRSKNALGLSPRCLDLAEVGNNYTSVYTEIPLIRVRDVIDATSFLYSQPENEAPLVIKRISGPGLSIKGEAIVQSLESLAALDTVDKNSICLEVIRCMNVGTGKPQQISIIVEQLERALDLYIDRIASLVSQETWTSSLSRDISSLLDSFPQEAVQLSLTPGLFPAFLLISRLARQVSMMILASFYDHIGEFENASEYKVALHDSLMILRSTLLLMIRDFKLVLREG